MKRMTEDEEIQNRTHLLLTPEMVEAIAGLIEAYASFIDLNDEDCEVYKQVYRMLGKGQLDSVNFKEIVKNAL